MALKAEMESLKTTQEDLEKGRHKLDNMLERIEKEQVLGTLYYIQLKHVFQCSIFIVESQSWSQICDSCKPGMKKSQKL